MYEKKKTAKQKTPTEWEEYYAQAYKIFNPQKYDTFAEAGHVFRPVPRDSVRMPVLFTRSSSVHEMRQAWQQLTVDERAQRWPLVMAEVMCYQRKHTLPLLVATYMKPYPPRRMLADALDLAAHVVLYNNAHELDRRTLKMLYDFTLRYLRTQRSPPLIRPHTIRLLIRYLDAAEARTLYAALNRHRVRIPREIGFRIVHEMARKLEMSAARHMLRRIVQKKPSVVHSQDFKLAAIVLLDHASKISYGREGLDILNELLGYGFRPDLTVYNISIFNAFRMNDARTAWKLYEALRADDLQPDSYTFATLIKGAKHRHDWDGIEQVTHDMHALGVKPNLWLVTEMLHTSYIYAHSKRRNSVFRDMTKIYQTFFSVDVLKELGMLSTNGGATPTTSDRISTTLVRPDPLPATMHVMLKSYLSHCGDWTILTELWARYKTSVASNPVWNTGGQNSAYVPTAFMYVFGQNPQTLLYCPTILADMLSSSSGLAKPTLQTWNVLMLAYVRNRQYQASERVLELMMEHGMTPDVVTWTSLVAGYAHGQDIKGAVGAVKRMLRAGFDVGERTVHALMRIQDRRQLAREMMVMEREWEMERKTMRVERLEERRKVEMGKKQGLRWRRYQQQQQQERERTRSRLQEGHSSDEDKSVVDVEEKMEAEVEVESKPPMITPSPAPATRWNYQSSTGVKYSMWDPPHLRNQQQPRPPNEPSSRPLAPAASEEPSPESHVFDVRAKKGDYVFRTWTPPANPPPSPQDHEQRRPPDIPPLSETHRNVRSKGEYVFMRWTPPTDQK